MTAREELLETIQCVLGRLPESATLREFIEEMEVMADIEDAEREIDEGKVLTFEEFKRRTDPCLLK